MGDTNPLNVPLARACPITGAACERACPTHGVWPWIIFAPCVRITEGLAP